MGSQSMKCDELKRFDVVGKYRDEETMYEFRPDGVCYDSDEVDAAIAELKQKLDDKEAENLKLKRALWLARAERAKESHFMWCQLIYDKKYGIVKFNVRKEWGENIKQGQMLHTPQGWADVWDDVERKCRAKAEEYK